MDMKKHNDDELFGSIWTHKMEKKKKKRRILLNLEPCPSGKGITTLVIYN
jgi:hypothetical protein